MGKMVLVGALALIVLTSYCVADEVMGCGGFVQLSDTLKQTRSKVDFSEIVLRLATNDGVEKQSTECAPNGYYFLPVNEPGSYTIHIEGPPGWAFAPKTAPVVVAQDKSCNGGDDVNFKFTGFMIHGKLVGDNRCGPKTGDVNGVTLSLALRSDPAKVLSTAVSEHSEYRFADVSPGQYVVTASHKSWSFEQASLDVDVVWHNMEVEKAFVVNGYDVSGRVVGTADEPVSGVDFLLYSKTIKSVPCTVTGDVPEVPGRTDKPLCHTKSARDGTFRFGSLPCGEYTIVPRYRSAVATFDVSPAEADFAIGHGGHVFREPFRMLGFSISGRVVDRQTGVPGVTIFVNGKERATTDQDGFYTIDHVASTSATYDIEAKKPHMFFTTMQVQISPTMAKLENIDVTGYHLCGRISIDNAPAGTASAANREVVLYTTDGQVEEKTRANADGSYCFETGPGRYTVSVTVSDAELRQGLLLSPASRPVEIVNAPFLTANFIQARVTVAGTVSCLEGDCSGVKVTLTSRSSSAKETANVVNGAFKFEQVLPGTHSLSVSEDNWCWDQRSQTIEVEAKDLTSLSFAQQGYVMKVDASQPVELVLQRSGSDGAPTSFNVAAGKSENCLRAPGVYTVTPRSCHKFEQDSYSYDTASPRLLKITATHFRVHGLIKVAAADGSAGAITVTIKGKKEGDSKTAQVTQVSNGVFEYTHWAVANERVVIRPTSEALLFYPEEQVVEVRNACPDAVADFESRQGVFLRGTLTPAVPGGATITVRYAHDGAKGDVLVTVKSAEDGSYSAGPLRDDQSYTLEPSRDGYEFNRGEGWNFHAVRLSSISVVVKDSNGRGIEGVVLSLSGVGYRNNQNTLADGTKVFGSLKPGEYFLRPMFEEYSFSPANEVIEIVEGKDASLTFTATRVAFSVFGRVTSLNGHGEAGVFVEGRSAAGTSKEAQTDKDGRYRLLGFKPGNDCVVRVKDSKGDIARATPDSATVKMGSEDVKGVDFIAFRPNNKYEISGHVDAPASVSSTLDVELYSGDTPDALVKTASLNPVNFFSFSLLPAGTYHVRTRTSANSRDFHYKSPFTTVTVGGNNSTARVVLPFSAEVHREVHEIANAPFYFLTLCVLGLVGGIYHKPLLQFYRSVTQPVYTGESGYEVREHSTRSKKRK